MVLAGHQFNVCLGHKGREEEYELQENTVEMDAWEKQVVDVSLKLNSVVERIV